MNILDEKLELIKWITSLEDISVLNALKTIKEDAEAGIIFVPMTKEELVERALASERAIENGDVFPIESIVEEDWDSL